MAVQLTDRDRQLLFLFVQEKNSQVSNSKPDWILDFLDLTNPEIQIFISNKIVLTQAGIASLDANKIQAEQRFNADIADLTVLGQKLGNPKP